MLLGPNYFLEPVISEVFLDKSTGEPLAGGQVFFYSDNARAQKKAIYTISGSPPNYTVTALPNPVTLSANGMITDNNGNIVPLYYFPYSSANNAQVENYYIQVYGPPPAPNMLGTFQFDRQNWPGINSNSGSSNLQSGYANLLGNNQFVDVLFNTTQNLVINWNSSNPNGTTTVQIAPDWFIKITAASGSGTVTVSRTPVSGTSNTVGNPPYYLMINPSGSPSTVSLYQRLFNNPDIWSATGNNGFLTGSIIVDIGPPVTMVYQDSATVPNFTTILSAPANSSGSPQMYANTVQLPQGLNPNTSVNGYIDIILQLNTTTATKIYGVQAVPTDSAVGNIAYQQQPVNYQLDHTFHFYKPKLDFKPVPSYLVGWDFPLNPAQFNGTTVAAQAVGANKSFYAWDQTIIFQTTNSGVSVSRAPSGAIRLTSAAGGGTQMAIIQYLDGQTVNELLQDRMSVYIAAAASNGASVNSTVSLWGSDDTGNTGMGSNNSIVATLNADGSVNSTNAGTGGHGWYNIPNVYGTLNGQGVISGYFTIPQAPTSAAGVYPFTDFRFSYFDYSGGTYQTSSNLFAIVIGTATLAHNQYIDIFSVGLCKGDIATRPAPKSAAETLLDCNQYYWMTFSPGTVPAQAVGTSTGEYQYSALQAAAATGNYAPSLFFSTAMRKTPTITFYNPMNANSHVYDEGAGVDCSAETTLALTQKSVVISCTGNGSTLVKDRLGVHITADARLGVV